MKNKITLEILVDRQNEKWAWAFDHILIVLHKILDKKPWFFDKNKWNIRPNFSFEIAKIWNKIRFFLVCEAMYENFIKNQIYAHYSNVEIYNIDNYLDNIPNDKLLIWKVWLEKHYIFPIKNFTEIQDSSSNAQIDPYSSITSSLNKVWNLSNLNAFQINFSPIWDSEWKSWADRIFDILKSKNPKFIKKFLLSKNFIYYKIAFFPLFLIFSFFSFFVSKLWSSPEDLEDINSDSSETKDDWKDKPDYFSSKLMWLWYWVDINVIFAWEDHLEWKMNIKEIVSTLWVFSYFWVNGFRLKSINNENNNILRVKNRSCNDSMILNTTELSWLVHLPTNYVKTPSVNWVVSRNFEPPSDLPILDSWKALTPIWKTNFRWDSIWFGMWSNDRRRHVYVIWKTWMGKSTLLENMIIDDIRNNKWVALIDPHGDLAEKVIWFVPKSRTNNVVIFDPSDSNWPIAFNMLDDVKQEHRPLVASWIVGIFKKIFGESWGPRLEHTLRNTILALLEYPNTTLISIPLMLTSDVYRWKVVSKIKDPVVKKFWTHEFAKMAPNQKVEASWPILNKVGQFLSSSILRNVLGQPKNTFSLRWAMDNEKIVIINLSKWKIWEDASALLWAMMVTKFQLDAMSRADIREDERKDFYLYVDEFQNFATDSFATILSEARKYKLNLVMANQYIDQMQESVRWAVFGNVWSLVSFQVWYHDSTILKEVFGSDITSEDLTNLRKYSIYTKLLIDGMPSRIFSADTFPPYSIDPEIFSSRYKKILKVSREKYSKPKDVVEEKIFDLIKQIEKQEDAWEKKKEKMKEEEKKRKQAEREKNLKK